MLLKIMAVSFLLEGNVDRITNDVVVVEIWPNAAYDYPGAILQVESSIFPCEIKEGEAFMVQRWENGPTFVFCEGEGLEPNYEGE